jgi:hypothetical protein
MPGARMLELAGKVTPCPCHVCALIHSKEQEEAILLPFMAAGIAAGDKCINIVEKSQRPSRLAALASAGIDVVVAEARGQLEIVSWEEAHLVGGHFDQSRMLDRLTESAERNDETYPMTRLWSNQEWALLDVPGVKDLVEYEARFNYVWPKHNSFVVCAYDARRFSLAALTQILQAHPFAILGNTIVENTAYVPPDDLLRELGRNP